MYVSRMNSNPMTPTHSTAIQNTATSYLARPDGRIGYDVAGDGPLLVLVPGMGDLRAAYRFLAPALRHAGYCVAWTCAGTATATPASPPTVMSRPPATSSP
jgi:alpha-beta hydrolase superfamily lysophospholipase